MNLENETTKPFDPAPEHTRMARWEGEWRGIARTWLDPAQPPTEATLEGRIAPLLGGRFVRFTYRSSLNGAPLAGELLIAFETSEKVWRTSWIDSFHTGSAILVSTSEPEAKDLNVRGTYFAAPEQPRWGWRTELLDPTDADLSLRMYNVSPEGKEDLGVEVALHRI